MASRRLNLRVFDRLFAGDIARLGLLFGGNPLGGEPLFLADTGCFGCLPRRDFGGIDCAVAGDLE